MLNQQSDSRALLSQSLFTAAAMKPIGVLNSGSNSSAAQRKQTTAAMAQPMGHSFKVDRVSILAKGGNSFNATQPLNKVTANRVQTVAKSDALSANMSNVDSNSLHHKSANGFVTRSSFLVGKPVGF